MRRVKVFTFLRQPEGAWQHALCSFLRDGFVPSLRRGPAAASMTAAVLNPVLQMNYRSVEGTNADGHDWSAILEFYFPDAQSALTAVEQAITPLLAERESEFAEASSIVVDEHLMYDTLKKPDPVKVHGFYRVSGMTRAQSHEHLAQDHAKTAVALKASSVIRRYFQNHTLPGYRNPQARYDYDGGSTVYFDTLDDAAKIYRNAEVMAASVPSERAMGAQTGDTVHIAVSEEVLFDTRSRNETFAT